MVWIAAGAIVECGVAYLDYSLAYYICRKIKGWF